MNDQPNSSTAAEIRENTDDRIENSTQFYDFAPIAYYTLNAQGIILRSNLRGAEFLGIDYPLAGDPAFANYVSYNYHAEFYEFLRKLFTTHKVQRCILNLQNSNKIKWVNIKAVANKDENLCVMTVLDVTDQQQLIDQLKYSENLTHAIMDSLSSSIAVLDEQGNIIHINQAWRQFAQENDGGADLAKGIGQNYFDACRLAADLPEARDIPDAMLEVLNGYRQQFMQEYPCDSPDIQRWFRLEVLPLLGAKGLVTQHIDITERKQLENNLREKERFLADSQAVAHVGSWMLDIATGILRWSAEAYRIYGLSPETDTPLNLVKFLELLHPEDRPAMQNWCDACLAGKNPEELEFRTSPAKSAPRWLLGRGQLETDTDGRPKRMIGTVQDISQQKAAKEALQNSEARFRGYFNLNMIGIAITSAQKKWLEINDRMCNIFGYTREELMQFTWLDLTHPDDLQSGIEMFDQLVAGDFDHYSLEKRYSKKDGSIVYVSSVGSCKRRADGSIDHFVTLIEDITARKLAEFALSESKAKYQELLQHMEFIREQERTRIAREIHDDLGSFLAALKLDLSWLNKNLAINQQQCQHKIQIMTQRIDSGLQAVKRIINNLRPSILDNFGLIAAIEWTVEDLRERTHIDCRLTLPKQAVTLDVDRSNAVFRITQEALTNILKHAEANQINITLEISENNLLMTISDDGCGIAIIPKTTALTYGIIGMQERARHFGGDVIITSQPKAGTSLRLCMPLTIISAENNHD